MITTWQSRNFDDMTSAMNEAVILAEATRDFLHYLYQQGRMPIDTRPLLDYERRAERRNIQYVIRLRDA